LDERLHLSRAGKTIGDQSAIAVRLLVPVPNGWKAQMVEVVTEFGQVLLAQHLRLSLVGTPGHAGKNSTAFALSATAALPEVWIRLWGGGQAEGKTQMT
jgi:hypothetical protein